MSLVKRCLSEENQISETESKLEEFLENRKENDKRDENVREKSNIYGGYLSEMQSMDNKDKDNKSRDNKLADKTEQI